jgi:DNA-binding HxlR family transcriptional regulator
MSEHSYNQYCPIAHALDLVGDRWALLIVRDLIVGPKRFTDLRAGLPGIGTNILTARLKHLEHSGVIERRYLPPPAASAVYALTPYGAELGASLEALACWGARTLGPPRPGQVRAPDGVVLAVHALFHGLAAAGARGSYALHVNDGNLDIELGARIGDDRSVSIGREAPAQSDVDVTIGADLVIALIGGRDSLSDAVRRGAARLEGDHAAIARLLEAAEHRAA